MIGGTKMTAENIAESTITQANGDITINNIGFSSEQVVDIIKRLTDPDAKSLAFDASKTADDRIVEANNKLIPTIEKENPDLFNRFKEPAIQISLRAVYNEYVKTDDIELGDGLIEMFIERLKVDERTTMQFIIDEALSILPKITKAQLNFITMFVFSRLTLYIRSNKEFDDKMSLMSASLLHIDAIRGQDIDYLKYIGLFTATQGMSYGVDLIGNLKRDYKVLFSKGIPLSELIIQLNNLHISNNIASKHLYKVKGRNDNFALGFVNDIALDNFIKNNNLEKHKESLFEIYNSNLYTDQEILQYMTEIDIKWQSYFKLFGKNNTLTNPLVATQLTYYVGLKNINKVLDMNISMDSLYQKA